MKPVHEDVAQLLHEAGVGKFAGEEGWFIGTVETPETPDTTITVTSTTSVKEGVMGNNEEDGVKQSFQIKIRGNTDLEADAKREACEIAIHKIGRFKVEPDTDYSNILKDDDGLRMPKDTNDRHIYVQNFTAYRQRRNS